VALIRLKMKMIVIATSIKLSNFSDGLTCVDSGAEMTFMTISMVLVRLLSSYLRIQQLGLLESCFDGFQEAKTTKAPKAGI